MKNLLIALAIFLIFSFLLIGIKNKNEQRAPSEFEKQKVAETVGWPLKIKGDFKIGIFAKDLENVRDLEFSSNGVLLASLTKQGKVVALVDKDNDGRAEQVKELLSRLDNPHGLAFYQNKLFVAEEDKVVRYSWDEQKLEVKFDKTLFFLPARAGGHFTRSLVFDRDGKLYVSIGSTCNVCIEKHPFSAAVIISDANGENPKVFAKGLRNTVFLTLNSDSNEVWGADMGRDYLGDELPPEEINIIGDGKDYGWPYCYGNKIHDDNFDTKGVNTCDGTEAAMYTFCAHCAPLGLIFIQSEQFPNKWQGDLLVSYHGSWNRSSPIGYKVVKLNVEGDRILGEDDFITGFIKDGQVLGRPVDLIFDRQGSLYISDDKAGVIYKVVKNE